VHSRFAKVISILPFANFLQLALYWDHLTESDVSRIISTVIIKWNLATNQADSQGETDVP